MNKQDKMINIGLGSLLIILIIIFIALLFDTNKTFKKVENEDKKEIIILNNEVLMPDLTGLTKEEAKDRLNSIGLGYYCKEQKTSDVEIYHICDQSIKVGTRVEKHTKVYLTESLGRGAFELPDLTPYTKEKAIEILENLNVNYLLKYENNREIGKDVVIKTIPKEGEELYEKDLVVVYISTGNDYINPQNNSRIYKNIKIMDILHQETLPVIFLQDILKIVDDETVRTYLDSLNWNELTSMEKMINTLIIKNINYYKENEIANSSIDIKEFHQYERTIDEILAIESKTNMEFRLYNWKNFKVFSDSFTLEKFDDSSNIIGTNIFLPKEEFKILANIPNDEVFEAFYDMINKFSYRSFFIYMSNYENFSNIEKEAAKYICNGSFSIEDLAEIGVDLEEK